MLPPAPIPPEQWRGPNLKRMQHHTDPTRLRSGFSVPLTLRAHRAAATLTDPGAGEHTQTAIRFAALFRGTQRLACWTEQHAIGLEGEVLPREASCLPRQCDGGRAIPLYRCLLRFGLWWACHGGCELGGAQRLRLELVPQFEPQVPDPLRNDLPAFLSPGRVAAPAVRVELGVFIGEGRLQGATVQIQF